MDKGIRCRTPTVQIIAYNAEVDTQQYRYACFGHNIGTLELCWKFITYEIWGLS